MSNTYRYYLEDFHVGRIFKIGGRRIGREEMLAFATRYDPQAFHLDDERQDRLPYGGIIASGWLTCAIGMRMMCDAFLREAACLGSPGVDHIRWLKPVRPGDTLSLRITVLETKVSQDNPGRGSMRSCCEMFNQSGELVLSMEGWGFFRSRGDLAFSDPEKPATGCRGQT